MEEKKTMKYMRQQDEKQETDRERGRENCFLLTSLPLFSLLVFLFLSLMSLSLCLCVCSSSSGCYFSSNPSNTDTSSPTCGFYSDFMTTFSLSSSCSVSCVGGYSPNITSFPCFGISGARSANWSCYTGCCCVYFCFLIFFVADDLFSQLCRVRFRRGGLKS